MIEYEEFKYNSSATIYVPNVSELSFPILTTENLFHKKALMSIRIFSTTYIHILQHIGTY